LDPSNLFHEKSFRLFCKNLLTGIPRLLLFAFFTLGTVAILITPLEVTG